jgi:uncharacterized protein (TIGR02246 family)
MLLSIAFVGVSGACAPAETPMPPDTTAEDLAAVGALREAWRTAFNAGDAAALTALYTDDAVIMNPGEATITGLAAIQAHYDDLFSRIDAEAQIHPEATDVDGSLGFDSGTFTNTATLKPGGEAVSEEGRYVVILRKQADGQWKVSREIGNRPTAPAPPAAGN